jgi:hypothetical protein
VCRVQRSFFLNEPLPHIVFSSFVLLRLVCLFLLLFLMKTTFKTKLLGLWHNGINHVFGFLLVVPSIIFF